MVRGGRLGKQSSSFHLTNLQVIPKTDFTRGIHHHFNNPFLRHTTTFTHFCFGIFEAEARIRGGVKYRGAASGALTFPPVFWQSLMSADNAAAASVKAHNGDASACQNKHALWRRRRDVIPSAGARLRSWFFDDSSLQWMSGWLQTASDREGEGEMALGIPVRS